MKRNCNIVTGATPRSTARWFDNRKDQSRNPAGFDIARFSAPKQNDLPKDAT